MAQQVNVIITDDMDGTEGTDDDKVETRRFALDMNVFEIDLRRSNYEQIQKALAPFIGKARTATHEYRRAVAPVNGNGTRRTTHVRAPRDRASRERAGNIRAWAKEEGITIGEKGRIPGDIERDYDVAHPTTF
jgi:hypothetical protein